MRVITCSALVLALLTACLAEDPKPDPVFVKMETDRISFEFKDAGLNGVVEWLATETGLKISVSAAAQRFALEKKLKITAKLKDVKLSAALRVLFENQGLAMKLDKGVIRLLDRDEFAGKPVTLRIDVRTLLAHVDSFVAPKVGLPEPESQSFG